MDEEFERRYAALSSRDTRFDGVFCTAVTSTGIYCRPSCPARTPKRENVRFYRTAAAAQAAGFRACRRCRPDATPGSPEWRARGDLVARAMRGIADGAIDRGGVPALARTLGVTPRHLHRLLLAEVGAGPLAIARAQRVQTARTLIETTSLSLAEIAFASGFSSIRQFNDTVREVFAVTPSLLRTTARTAGNRAPAGIHLRLPMRLPMALTPLLQFLGARALAGVEEIRDGTYRRTLRLPHGAAIAELSDAGTHVACRLQLESMRDLGAAVARCRRLLDLDADPAAVDAHLGADPVLGGWVRANPGRRVPGAVDGVEIAVRAVVGQQVSIAGARTVISRIVAAAGVSSPLPDASLTHLFPTAAEMLALEPAVFAMPAARYAAIRGVLEAVVSGDISLDPTADSAATQRDLLALPGIGPWTVAYIAMRSLGDPDAFLASDLGVRRGIEALGQTGDPRSATLLAERWRPWRSYALQHLWNSIPAA